MTAFISETRSGKANAAYRTPAWHSLGTVTGEFMTAQEALAASGLDFDVRSQPVIIQLDEGGTEVISDELKVNYMIDNEGTPRILGVVGSERTNVNPRDLLSWMDDVVGEVEGRHYDNIVSIRDFKQLFATINMGEVVLDAEGRADVNYPYLFGYCSYDSSLGYGAKFAMFRPDCANMFAMAMKATTTEWKTKHTKDLAARATVAKKVLGLQKGYVDEWAKFGEEMIHEELTASGFDKWVGGLFEGVRKKHGDDELDREAMSQVRVIYEHMPSCEKIRGTVWGALNAATEYSDWFVDYRGGKKTTVEEMAFLRQVGSEGRGTRYGGGFKEDVTDWCREYVNA